MRQQAGDKAYALKWQNKKMGRALFPVSSETCLLPDFLRQTPCVFKSLELDFLLFAAECDPDWKSEGDQRGNQYNHL